MCFIIIILYSRRNDNYFSSLIFIPSDTIEQDGGGKRGRLRAYININTNSVRV